jgi:hypothetical protein
MSLTDDDESAGISSELSSLGALSLVSASSTSPDFDELMRQRNGRGP